MHKNRQNSVDIIGNIRLEGGMDTKPTIDEIKTALKNFTDFSVSEINEMLERLYDLEEE
jgi:hypothetical protein